MKLIDVSGLGQSGKTAITDVFREVEGVHAHNNSFEFDLIRLPDGILDLQQSLCDNWSPSRSDIALKRYRKFCKSLDSHYSEILTEKFMEYTEKYLESLVIGLLYIEEWYDSLYNNNDKNCFKEKMKNILKRLGIFHLAKKGYGQLKSIRYKPGNKTKVFLSDGNMFIDKTKAYLEKVIFSGLGNNINTVVVNNAFEPFNPRQNFEFFNNAFSVVVDRDPRDIYASVVKVEEAFVPQFETKEGLFTANYLQQLKKDMLGTKDINLFIKRQRLYREKMKFDKNDKRIIYIYYEDLVLDYDKTVQELFTKVGINPDLHKKKKQYFNPAQSSKNVGIWKKMKDSDEIKKIEKGLKEYLYTS